MQPFGVALVSALIIKHLERTSSTDRIDAVLAPGALGFMLAGPIASTFCLPLLLARKAEPVFGTFHKTASSGSNMSNLTKTCVKKYNGDKQNFFMVAGTIIPAQRVLVVDDCVATGAHLKHYLDWSAIKVELLSSLLL